MYGELAGAGADMFGLSQLLGGNADVGWPTCCCPEMSMLDWETGAGNARFWTTKMLIDGLGNDPKAVMPSCRAQSGPSEQSSADVYIRGFRGGQLPGPSNHAVLVASMVNVTRSITLEGAGAGTLIWMVAHRAAGHDNVSYSKGVLSGAEITLSPFTVALVFVSSTAAHLKADDDAAAAPRTDDQELGLLAHCVVGGVAKASCFSFNETDSTSAVQSALNSSASTVIVDRMPRPWVVRPLRLFRSNRRIVFESGVILQAKRGEFQARTTALLALIGSGAFGDCAAWPGGCNGTFSRRPRLENVSIEGFGATFRMHRSDYAGWTRFQNVTYQKAEWRHGLALVGVRNVSVAGLRIEETGGDGLYIDQSCAEQGPHCRGSTNVHAHDLVLDRNYRKW